MKLQSILKNLPISALVLAIILGYNALTHAMHLEGYWAGYLFLWYFLVVAEGDFTRIIETVAGGITGMLIALCIAIIPMTSLLNIIALIAMIVLLFAFLATNQFPKFINNSTTLTLTVFTMVELALPDKIVSSVVGYMFGVLVFGLVIYVINLFTKKKDMGLESEV